MKNRMPKRKTYKDKIGDGYFPNQYWVSISNDYYYIDVTNEMNCIEDLVPVFKSNGKTYPKPFKTYKEAKDFSDSLILGEKYDGIAVNRINIEDRLSGELYEKTMIFNLETCKVEEVEEEDIRFTKNKFVKAGIKFK